VIYTTVGALGNTNQGFLVPDDTLGLVGIGVGKALNLTGLATEEAEQRRTDLVAATLFDGMTLVAAGLEELSTLRSVTCRRGQLTVVHHRGIWIGTARER
jgi:hypothetical protein